MFKKIALALIRFYQKYLVFRSPCRFLPTCSEYSYQAINKYGIIFGGWKSVVRILKCNPWNKGGEDPLK
jgi:putative membrane protein insertion efficiency factor